jgi:hypothetical protein
MKPKNVLLSTLAILMLVVVTAAPTAHAVFCYVGAHVEELRSEEGCGGSEHNGYLITAYLDAGQFEIQPSPDHTATFIAFPVLGDDPTIYERYELPWIEKVNFQVTPSGNPTNILSPTWQVPPAPELKGKWWIHLLVSGWPGVVCSDEIDFELN